MKTTALSRLYDYMTFETIVLHSYINRVENDVNQGIKSYKTNIDVVFEEEFEEDNQFFYHSVEECEGLDSDTFSFESVFEEYFPRLQRASALITLCSFFEHSLIRLCNDLQKEFSIGLNVKDINGRGIESAITYLIKVVGLEIDKGTQVYSEIMNIQKIRHSFVHQDGLITDKVDKYVDSNEYLSGDTKININDGFLLHTLNNYKVFFQSIHDALSKKYHNSK